MWWVDMCARLEIWKKSLNTITGSWWSFWHCILMLAKPTRIKISWSRDMVLEDIAASWMAGVSRSTAWGTNEASRRSTGDGNWCDVDHVDLVFSWKTTAGRIETSLVVGVDTTRGAASTTETAKDVFENHKSVGYVGAGCEDSGKVDNDIRA